MADYSADRSEEQMPGLWSARRLCPRRMAVSSDARLGPRKDLWIGVARYFFFTPLLGGCVTARDLNHPELKHPFRLSDNNSERRGKQHDYNQPSRFITA